MKESILEMPRAVRRRLKRVAQKDRDADYRRRATALLLLHAGYTMKDTAERVQASRTSVQAWCKRYTCFGESGLVPQTRGRPVETVTEALCRSLLTLIQVSPDTYGYLRSRWTSEMLAEQLYEAHGMAIHASTVRRTLPRLGIVWNRARPTLCLPDRHKRRKMRAIRQALDQASDTRPVFYVDEADIDLNPRIGNEWMQKGVQTAIPTPGKNQKRYLAGALNATTGNVVWVEWAKKNSEIFILLLVQLRKRYRHAKKIILIVDNYVIHKSAMTQCFLKCHPKFELLFQPAYHPWVNKIELLWQQLHDNITRHHRHSTMKNLMTAVRYFMNGVSPYPGSAVQFLRA